MSDNDLFFVPVNFDVATVLLGHIRYVRKQTTQSLKETMPSEVHLVDGGSIDIPMSVEQATERMYRRSTEFKRSVCG